MLKGVRAILLVLIMVVAIGFTVMNPGERVRVDLFFIEPLENVPMVEALFFAFVLELLFVLEFFKHFVRPDDNLILFGQW